MEYNEGTWCISGCAEDSSARLFAAADLLREVKKTGFLPLFANEIPRFSVEERTTTSSWWTGDPGNPETKWGYDHIVSGYHEDPKESWKKIVDQVKNCASLASDQDIEKLPGIKYPGEL